MDGYYDCLFFSGTRIIPIKLASSAFDGLFAFFRENKTEDEPSTTCQLEITMNAGTPKEYTLKLENVWQIVSNYCPQFVVGVN